jgi:hypothetical protein
MIRIEQNISVAEMRMLRWTNGVTKENRKRNEYVKGNIGLASIKDKKRENRSRWFGHVMRPGPD